MMKEKENKKIEEETPRLASPHLKWMGLSMIFSMQGFRIQVLQICSHRTFSRPNRFQFDKTSSVCTFSLHISYSSVSSAIADPIPNPHPVVIEYIPIALARSPAGLPVRSLSSHHPLSLANDQQLGSARFTGTSNIPWRMRPINGRYVFPMS